MKKQALIFALMAMAVGSASATNTTPTGVSQAQAQDTKVTSVAEAGANNAGNSQTINFNSPSVSTVTQNVTGTQTTVLDQTVNGTQTTVVKGGTDNTIHQTFGTQTIKNTPSVSGPPLTSSNDTCMGSASGSANAPGFGISVGKTYVDENCKMLKNSRELWNMGMKAAAMALMCMDSNNRAALEMTGFVCPQSVARAAVVVEREAALKAGEPVDPIVRQRMGLPKIKE